MVDVTLMRAYQDDPGFAGRAVSNPLTDVKQMNHAPGWTFLGEAPVQAGFLQVSSTPAFVIPPINGTHFDVVEGATPGNISQISTYLPAVTDSVINVSTTIFALPGVSLHQSFPSWQLNAGGALLTQSQTYPSMREVYNQTPYSEFNSSYSWGSDWAAMNGSVGNGQNSGDTTNLFRTLTNIRGTTYDSGNTTTIVYQIPVVSPSVNIKIAPMYLTNWPHGMFTDVSGPGSLISDANEGKFLRGIFRRRVSPQFYCRTSVRFDAAFYG